MGKTSSLFVCALLLAAGILLPHPANAASARQAATVSCSGTPLVTPMLGHYTGPWHSDGDYHFAVFNTDLELKIIIDGTIDLTISATGLVSGSVTGDVNAPIFDYGKQDVSSGIGSISGQLDGQFSAAGSLLVLSHPVIDMHWGTFGGHAVERLITMPDYQFPVSALDCVSSQGSISEDGFPVMNVVADGAGLITQAPGIGNAAGSWQLTSDKAARFHDLSGQVDSFMAQANSFLGNHAGRLTPASVQQAIIQPLTALESSIRQEPSVARCLMDRLGAWEASVVPGMYQQAHYLAVATSASFLRQASDLLRVAGELDADCRLDDGGALSAVRDGVDTALTRALTSRSWPDAALLAREALLLQGRDAQPFLQGRINAGIHTLLQGTNDPAITLEIARLAYTFRDDADSAAALNRLTTHLRAQSSATRGKKRKKKRPPAVPAPASPAQLLRAGVVQMTAHSGGGATPSFTWQSVPGAARYVLVVVDSGQSAVIWSWSGTSTSVTYGDTAIDGVPGTGGETWQAPLGTSGASWSLIGFDQLGRIVGVKLRSSV